MKVTGIIKDAFLFPSKNTGRFAIYLLLSVLLVLFAFGGILTYVLGIIDSPNYLLGGIYLIIALLIGLLIEGYHVSVIRAGIEHDDDVPVFKLFENFMTGFDNAIVLFFYYLIPTLLVALVGLDTDIIGNAISVVKECVIQAFNVYIMGTSSEIAVNAITPALTNLVTSISITISVALVLYTIFSFIRAIAEVRLANTGSLKEALNILETLKDIKRIGIIKVILLIALFYLVIAITEIILLIIVGYFPFLVTTIYIIISPYLILVTKRALGLLYSDIT